METTHMPNAQPKRCSWVNVDHVLMREYHDREWGVPAHDDRTHFEFLILEAAQAGLSWSIVLNKRNGYRRAFSDFNPEKVARYSAARIDKLANDPGIIRNRAKIAAAVKNARAFLAVREERGSFDAYCWQFVDGRPRQNRWTTMPQIPVTTRESDAFSHRDLQPYAGSRDGQRPSHRLFPISRRPAARHQRRMNLSLLAARLGLSS
jgi:DNA-3-methyladenine glycosylase I